jgi:hypothetical protein
MLPFEQSVFSTLINDVLQTSIEKKEIVTSITRWIKSYSKYNPKAKFSSIPSEKIEEIFTQFDHHL